jgi:hypothetical protein
MREMQYGSEIAGKDKCKKRAAACAGVFGRSSRASRESIDKGKALCRKPSSWIGGVLLTRTRPTMRVDCGFSEKRSDTDMGKDGRKGPESERLGGVAIRQQSGQGVDRVEWIYASDSVPDRTIQLECVGW